MIKEIRCQFEDVKDFQRFVLLNGKEYIKVPSPNIPFKIKVVKEWEGEVYENFSPNAYNLKLRRYTEIGLKEDCIIYPKADKEQIK